MENLKINHLAVWLSVVLLFALGFLWYGPLFGETWMGMVGLSREFMEANPPGAGIWISNVIGTVITVYVLAWLFTKLKINNALKGFIYGLLIAFSFNFLSTMVSGMYAQYPYGLAWITGGFDMTAMALSGLILGAWTKTGKED